LVIENLVLNVISAYAPQVDLSNDVKRQSGEDLEDMIREVYSSEKLFIGGDFNSHVDTAKSGFEMVHGDFGYDEQNQEREKILNFVVYDLMVANTFFRKNNLI
jgi:hypothetical protein